MCLILYEYKFVLDMAAALLADTIVNKAGVELIVERTETY